MPNKNHNQIAGAIIIAGVLIAGAILIKGKTTVNPTVVANKPDLSAIKFKAVSPDEHIKGNQNAKVVIVEYSDLECPFCKVFDGTMKQVMQQYGDKITWVYRQYPIDQLHPKSRKESEASECAWEQGGNDMFWKYIDKIFAITPSNNKLDPAELPKIAKDLGLDVTAFNTCLSSGKYTQKVQASIDDGSSVGVNGTPSSFILKNGKLFDTINGAYPLLDISKKIDAALK